MKIGFLVRVLTVVLVLALVFPMVVLALPPLPYPIKPVLWVPFPEEGVQNGIPSEATLVLRYFGEEIDPFKDVSLEIVFTNGAATIVVPGFFTGQRSYGGSGQSVHEYTFKARMFYPSAGVWSYQPRLSLPSLPPFDDALGRERGMAGSSWLTEGRVRVLPSDNPGVMRSGAMASFPNALYVGDRAVFGCYIEAWGLPVVDSVRQELFVRQAKEKLCSPGSTVVLKVTMHAVLGIEPGVELNVNPFTTDREHYNLSLFEGLDRLLDISLRQGVFLHINPTIEPYQLTDFTNPWSPDSRILVKLVDQVMARAASFRNVLWEVGNELDARYEWQRRWIDSWASHVKGKSVFGQIVTVNAKTTNCYAGRAYRSSFSDVADDHVCNKGGVSYAKALEARALGKPVILTEYSMVRAGNWSNFEKAVETIDGVMAGSPLQFWGEWLDLDAITIFKDVASEWRERGVTVPGALVSPRSRQDVGIGVVYNMGLFWEEAYLPYLYPQGSATPGSVSGRIAVNSTNATVRLLAKCRPTDNFCGGRFVVFLRANAGQRINGSILLASDSTSLSKYRLSGFDPKTGQWRTLGVVTPDEGGRIRVEVPESVFEYYLLYLLG